MNVSLLSKWWWRFKHEKESIWGRTIMAIHTNTDSGSYLPVKEGISGTWNGIVKMGKELELYNLNFGTMIKGELGNGRDIRVWLDWWVGDAPLRDQFPELFNLERHKRATAEEILIEWNLETIA
ncbi:hypothetical protein HanIR_Chr06g0285521 [Helianthus annuus]|nr:hypothetical protein HanIR_Chr06g0285521 [Helianthus annuus]